MNKSAKIAISVLSILLLISILANVKFIFGHQKEILDKNLIKRNNEIIDSLTTENKSLIDLIEENDKSGAKEEGSVEKEKKNVAVANKDIKSQEKDYDEKIRYIDNGTVDSINRIYTDILSKNKDFK